MHNGSALPARRTSVSHPASGPPDWASMAVAAHTHSLHSASLPSPWEPPGSPNPFPGHNDCLTRFTLGGSPCWGCGGGGPFVCAAHLQSIQRLDFTLTPSKRGGGGGGSAAAPAFHHSISSICVSPDPCRSSGTREASLAASSEGFPHVTFTLLQPQRLRLVRHRAQKKKEGRSSAPHPPPASRPPPQSAGEKRKEENENEIRA